VGHPHGGLSAHRRSRTGELSGGWKQRLALGCAVLHEPPVVFLDEPTSGVDPASRRRFWDLIYEMAAAGTTVFVTTHYLDEAEYCGRLGLIYRGELIALGTPAELKTRLMREEVVEVLCARPHEAMDAVAAVEGVREAALYGAGLHAVVASAERAAPAIRGRLAELGFEPERVERIAPSLEDVFVSLIEAHDRAEGLSS
jgi:ABC-2 type transport system ATP-binding protein